MKMSPVFSGIKLSCATFVLTIALILSTTVTNHAQTETSQPTNIAAGSYIIPMDNVNQGNASGTTFNLRAYGLVNHLLHNNIPVKWIIKDGKAMDAADLTGVSFTRVAGVVGSGSGSNASFSGGPFIIDAEYAPAAIGFITAYNNLVAGTSDDVVVYRVTNPILNAPVRYELTHKPYIAVGVDGGNYGSSVNQALFKRAGITSQYYQAAPDDIIGSNSCFTIATQAHSTNATYVNNYRSFVTNGGNLLLQCASIDTFENTASGHFQSIRNNNSTASDSYAVFGTNDNTDVNTTLVYPNPAMPFNQFVGSLDNQDGAITEYSLITSPYVSVFTNGTQIAARNSGTQTAKMVATVSKVANSGREGGHVFALAGHDYTRGNGSAIAKLNGQRMILNTIFVPVTRPCGIVGTPTVWGYKSVRLTTDVGYPGMSPNDTVTWTIDYVNTGDAPALNFMIEDPLPLDRVDFVGPAVLVNATNSTGVVLNPSFNGGTNVNLINSGATLGVNGRITIQVKTKIKNGFYGTILNQTKATAAGISSAGVRSDTIDNGTLGTFGNVSAPTGSVCQELGGGCTNNFQTPGIDPTGVSLFAPTAAEASISGSVLDPFGNGLSRTTVTITNGTTGESKTAVTNAFGFYSVDGLDIGTLYTVSASHRRYTFVESMFSFMLNDNVAGLTFVAVDESGSKTSAR